MMRLRNETRIDRARVTRVARSRLAALVARARGAAAVVFVVGTVAAASPAGATVGTDSASSAVRLSAMGMPVALPAALANPAGEADRGRQFAQAVGAPPSGASDQAAPSGPDVAPFSMSPTDGTPTPGSQTNAGGVPRAPDFTPTRDGEFLPPVDAPPDSPASGSDGFSLQQASPPAAPSSSPGEDLPPPTVTPAAPTARTGTGSAMPPPIPFDLPVSGGGSPTASRVSPAAAQRINRFLLDRPDVRLTGEIDAVSAPIFLTPAEASQSARISVGFVNSVVVMPEASRLVVWVNGQKTIEVPIEATSDPLYFEFPLPAGLLRPGMNQVRIGASMRHRVDCSIGGTYELWTQLVPAMTGLSFSSGAQPVSRVSDLPSVGADDTGATRIYALNTGASDPVSIGRMLKAAQVASVLGRFRHPVVTVVESLDKVPVAPGAMVLAVGTVADVRPLTSAGASEGVNGPIVAFQNEPSRGVPILVLSGGNAAQVDAAIDRLNALVERDINQTRAAGRLPWRVPDVPAYLGGESYTFRELGVPTEEFSGRHFKTSFEFNLPPDFYAQGYANVNFRIDAAYTPEVLAGSTLQFYVNDEIAMTFNLTSTDGEFLRQRLITVPMKSFRPGTNVVRVEANLATRTDQACLPGTTMNQAKRFVLFNTSRLIIPVFARLGVLPNLAAFSANGFPLGVGTDQPVAVYVPGGQPAAGAAATLMAKLAVSRGRVFNIAAATAAAQIDHRPAVIVSALPDLDPGILTRVGLAELALGAQSLPQNHTSDASVPAQGGAGKDAGTFDALLSQVEALREQQQDGVYGVPVDQAADNAAGAANMDDTGAIYARWREGMSGADQVRKWFRDMMRWIDDAIGINAQNLGASLGGGSQAEVPAQYTALIAQNFAESSGMTTWTLLTADDNTALATGAEGITAPQAWRRLDGQLSSYLRQTGLVRTSADLKQRVFETVPFSITNWRLIAANWFSLHIVSYAFFLILASAALGVATWIMINLTRKGDLW
ncbi:cellulose synthase subunit [Pseudoxanthobacter soli DSM 19599]|uniref:Cyclic di-GMP-binding protein n=2 Tax=Pseudoxanthobacter TaxID=433838 RepID=A0A1M7ZQE5_9HYPH|nr:cellulose synthase subunit [Pseudoxanthobacter soli DSM 19599]